MTAAATSSRFVATIAGLIVAAAFFATGQAYAQREFLIVGTVDCGRASGRPCSIDDEVRLWTDDVTGERARFVVDVSWIKKQMGSYKQDDQICIEVRVQPDGALQAIAISDTCGKPPPTRRPTDEPRNERTVALQPTPAPHTPTPASEPSADLSLTKTGESIECGEGCNLEWIVTIHNDGPDTATNVVVQDFPDDGIFDCFENTTKGTYDDSTRRWEVGTLAPGETATLELDCDGFKGQIEHFENVAEIVQVDQKDPDSTPNNDQPGEDDQARAELEDD